MRLRWRRIVVRAARFPGAALGHQTPFAVNIRGSAARCGRDNSQCERPSGAAGGAGRCKKQPRPPAALAARRRLAGQSFAQGVRPAGRVCEGVWIAKRSELRTFKVKLQALNCWARLAGQEPQAVQEQRRAAAQYPLAVHSSPAALAWRDRHGWPVIQLLYP